MVEAKKKKSYWFGVFAEYYVICLFAIFGYRFLTRRYKTKLGEIDLIFRKGNAIVAVEVKARSDYKTEVGEVVHERQFYRIVNSLKIFLNKNEKYSNFDVRVDVVLVYRNLKIRHIKNVWVE